MELRRFFRRPNHQELAHEIDDELALHVELRARDLEAQGHDPEAALNEARRRMGDIERYRDEALAIRDAQIKGQERARIWSELGQDIRIGLRSQLRKPGVPFMIVALLVLGVAANAAMFSFVKTVLLDPLPYPEADRLVILWQTRARYTRLPASYPNLRDWQEQSGSFQGIGGVAPVYVSLSGQGQAERVLGALVSASLLDLLQVQPQLGRTFLPQDDLPDAPPVAVLSHGLWQSRFGGRSDVLGTSVDVDGEPTTVVGVMPVGFQEPRPWLIGQRSDIWVPLASSRLALSAAGDRGTHWLAAIARLRPGVSLDSAREEMNAIAQGIAGQYPESDSGGGVRIAQLQKELVGDSEAQLLLLLGGAGLVLLVVCANLGGLLLARSEARSGEMSTRSALGASRWRLTRQLLAESLPLSILAGGAAFLLAAWGIRALRAVLPASIPRIGEAAVDARVFFFTLALSLLAGLLFTLAPAWSATRLSLADALRQARGSRAPGPHRLRTRRLLVIGQLAVTVVLANAGVLMVKSYLALSHRNYSFDTERVLTMGITLQGTRYRELEAVRAFYQEVVERVCRLPGVVSAAATSKLPLEGGCNSSITQADGHDFADEAGPTAEFSVVTADFFETMGIPLLRGRTLAPEDGVGGGPLPAVINRTMQERLWPTEDPIGKRFGLGSSQDLVVIGVVESVPQFGAERRPLPEVYLPYTPTPPHPSYSFGAVRFLVVRADSDPLGVAAVIRDEIARVDPDQPISEIRSSADLLSSALARRKLSTLLVGLFAAAALVLVAVGLYGIMAFLVASRTHEIGIRMAMGADWAGIRRLVLTTGVRLLAAGIAAGLLGVLVTTRLTSSLIYGVGPLDPSTLGLVILSLLGIGLLASLVPAFRAARVDPVVALREE